MVEDATAQPSSRGRRAWTVAAAATVAAVAAWFAHAALGRPYHLDTTLYLRDLAALLRDGSAPSAFPSRTGNVWIYLPAYALLGEAGVRWTNVAAIAGLVALYLAVLRRDFGRADAWAAAVSLATTPALVLGVSHWKEDANALVLLAAALAVARPGAGPARAAAAGVLAGLALLCKEFVVLFLPFVAAHVHLAAARPASWRELLRWAPLRAAAPATLAFLLAALAAVLAVAPGQFRAMAAITDSPYMGQFLGLEALRSPQPWAAWRDGALHAAALPAFVLVAVAVAVVRAEPAPVLWAGAGVAALLALGTTTVTTGRVLAPAFFLLLPPAWRGVRLALEGALRLVRPAAAPASAAATSLLAAGLAAWQLHDVGPTLAYRRAYPPQAAYFEGLDAALPPGALLYGMENCQLVDHFTGRPCRTGLLRVDPATVRTFVDGLVEEARRRPVFLLHDFAAYDVFSGGVGRELAARARLEVAYSGVGEDYHGMDHGWALPIAADLARVERTMPSCRLVRAETLPIPDAPAEGFELGRATFRCGEAERTREFFAHRGRVTALARLDVLRVVPR